MLVSIRQAEAANPVKLIVEAGVYWTLHRRVLDMLEAVGAD
jgi:hypothetical protein